MDRSTYAYEYREGDQPAYGLIAASSIAKGRITAVDTEAAENSPGAHDLEAAQAGAVPPKSSNCNPSDTSKGDVEAASMSNHAGRYGSRGRGNRG